MEAKLQRKAAKYMREFPTVKNLHIVQNPKGSSRRFTATFDMKGDNYRVHFGTSYDTYFDGAPKTKRDSYRARASKITNRNGKFTFRIAGTKNSLAYHILW